MATKKKAVPAPAKKTKAEKQKTLTVVPPTPLPETFPEDDDGIVLPDSVGGLSDMCDSLWEEISKEANKEKRGQLILKYNMAAGKCNTLAKRDMLTIITAKTKVVSIKEEEPEEKETPHFVGKEINFCFAGGKVKGKISEFTSDDTMKVIEGDGTKYHIHVHDIIIGNKTASQHLSTVKGKKKVETAATTDPKAVKPSKIKTTTATKEAAGGKTAPGTMKITAAIKKIIAQGAGVPGAKIIREVYDEAGANFNVDDFVQATLESGNEINKSRTIGCLKKYVKNFKW